MKHSIFCLVGLVAFSMFFFYSCSKQVVPEKSEGDLYDEMLAFSYHYSELKDQIADLTKSESINSGMQILSYDRNRIDSKYWEYLDKYFMSDCIFDWDEKAILNDVENDKRFSQKERVQFAKLIACAYYCKEEMAELSTKATAAELCRQAFDLAVARASRNYVIAMAAAILLEPTVAGEALATVYYYAAITDAETDYNMCMKAAE